MSQLDRQTAIVGVGSTPILRRTDIGIAALGVDAALDAIQDAGITPDEIDGYVGAPSATNAGALGIDGADELSQRLLAKELGLKNLKWSADLYWDFPASQIALAAQALMSGACTRILIVRAMAHLETGGKYGANPNIHAHGEAQFESPYGYRTAGARFAIRCRDYLERSGATREDLFNVVSLARENAALNPLAVWRDRGVSREEYFAAPMIAEPLCRYDCDMPVSGAAAFVMTRADIAAGHPHAPIFLSGSAGWQAPEAIFDRSGRSREDIQLCQLYDGFSSMIFEWLERLGWCSPGTAWKFLRDGECRRGGKLPLNTFGGSLGEGRLHGAGHVREAVLQLRGKAGPRQVPNAENCLVQNGPHDYSSLLILSRFPHKSGQ